MWAGDRSPGPVIGGHAVSRFLCRPLLILRTAEAAFGPARAIPVGVVDSARLILLRRGHIRYRVEGETMPLRGPSLVYVPSWSKRGWQAMSRRKAEIIYCEFVCLDAVVPGPRAMWTDRLDASLEDAAMVRLMAANQERSAMGDAQAAAELRAMLVRFLRSARPLGAHRTPAAAPRQTTAVDLAIDWIAIHHAEADVLDGLSDRVGLSANHFRRVFRRQTGLTPGGMVAIWRMRDARFRIHAGAASIKQVAAAVGYRDPLYFSRLYRRFWGVSPQADAR